MWDTSKLTVELRELIENGIDLWDFDYPSYYEGEVKRAFERKVIDHYYFRQIGQETPARFLHMFRTRIREIMPYYIQRYKSVEIMDKIDDPFESYNLTETYEQERVGSGEASVTTSTETSSSSNTSATASSETENDKGITINKQDIIEKTKRFSNTPQGSITNLDKYLTEATQDNEDITVTENNNEHAEESSSSSTSSDTTATSTEGGSSESSTSDTETVKHILTRKGNIGVATLAQEMNSFRTSFINVDLEIINELNDLFLLIY